jgi:RNA-directed DNA polymerase
MLPVGWTDRGVAPGPRALGYEQATIAELRGQYCRGGWWPASQHREMFHPEKVGTTRYRYRGSVIPSPWPSTDEDTQAA